MRLSVNKSSGLRLLRDLRRRQVLTALRRCDPLVPDPRPRQRWRAELVPTGELALDGPPSEHRPLEIAVPGRAFRPRASFFLSTVYGAGLPHEAFLDLGNGLAVAGPELLFLEMAPVMPAPAHVMLGYELCGTFGRDPCRPRTGDVTFDLAPATNVDRIRGFVRGCRYFGHARSLALERLAYVADNAWSPMEAVLATMLALPVEEYGYGLGPVALNVRRENAPYLVERGSPSSRVPDIELVGSPLGFNYDGRAHFDLASIAASRTESELARALRLVREKYVDDLRRNRELAASGLVVLPVTSEDLFHEGGCDALVFEALSLLRALGRGAPASSWLTLESAPLVERRQETLWSILPWSEAPRYARVMQDREERAFGQAYAEETAVAF